MPPCLAKGKSFSEEEITKTRRIASVRVFVEHIMRRLKEWRIFDFFNALQSRDTSQLFSVAMYLQLLKKPLIPTDPEILTEMLGWEEAEDFE